MKRCVGVQLCYDQWPEHDLRGVALSELSKLELSEGGKSTREMRWARVHLGLPVVPLPCLSLSLSASSARHPPPRWLHY
jgi:hypothetical protein